MFTECLKTVGGQYTSATVARYGHLVGHLSSELDRAYSENVAQSCIGSRSSDPSVAVARKAKIQKIISLLWAEHLVEPMPGREFKAYPGFTYSEPGTTQKLREKLVNLAKRIDRLQRVRRRAE